MFYETQLVYRRSAYGSPLSLFKDMYNSLRTIDIGSRSLSRSSSVCIWLNTYVSFINISNSKFVSSLYCEKVRIIKPTKYESRIKDLNMSVFTIAFVNGDRRTAKLFILNLKFLLYDSAVMKSKNIPKNKRIVFVWIRSHAFRTNG